MNEINARKISVLYGSQTGNAQDVSERIWRESKRFYFNCFVKPMDDYAINELINETFIIFVCSTTGQGDEPDNMKSFWKFLLKKSLPTNSLSKMKCCVLGLGDSSYTKFNFVAKRLNKRLAQLGAEMILPLALGDDQHDLGYDAVVDVWMKSLWEELLKLYPLPLDLQPLDISHIIYPRWKVEPCDANLNNVYNKDDTIYYNNDVKIPNSQCLVKMKENARITSATHFQDVRLIKFSTEGQNYCPGDVINMRPKNSKEQVNEFYDILESNGVHINPDTFYNISERDSGMPVPSFLKKSIKFQKLCEEYFDLSSIPRRYVFSVFAQLSTSELEKEKCIEFTSPEGQNELYNYCNRPKRNITEVLRDFPHVVKNMTIEMLFEILPPIKSRAFSIASSGNAHKNEIHILMAVVQYKTKLYKKRLGLCSNWLANLNINENIPVWITKGTFRFPHQENIPVIMIGPGTGIAPFRSYIFEQYHYGKAVSSNLILFFGCRYQNHDFHCKDELTELHINNNLFLICAFSRDQGDKIYVQHKIREFGNKMWELIQLKNAYIFVAGNSKNMPQSVREAFIDVISKNKEVSFEDAEKVIIDLEKNGRYQTETWS